VVCREKVLSADYKATLSNRMRLIRQGEAITRAKKQVGRFLKGPDEMSENQKWITVEKKSGTG